MSDWDKMALICVVIGFEADILGLVSYTSFLGSWYHRDASAGLLIVAFGLYTIGSLILASSKLTGTVVNLAMTIVVMICTFVAGVFLVIGVGLFSDGNKNVPYSATLLMSAAFLALLSFIFLMVHLCCRGYNKSSATVSSVA